eukprot:scaffold59493_cov73-Phaeocystis_antarctica.AAC.1
MHARLHSRPPQPSCVRPQLFHTHRVPQTPKHRSHDETKRLAPGRQALAPEAQEAGASQDGRDQDHGRPSSQVARGLLRAELRRRRNRAVDHRARGHGEAL